MYDLEHQGGARDGAGRAERHQEGQVYAAGQNGRTEEQHEDSSTAESATQTGPQTEPSEEGNTADFIFVKWSCDNISAFSV